MLPPFVIPLKAGIQWSGTLSQAEFPPSGE